MDIAQLGIDLLATLFLLAPLYLAFLMDRQVNAFQREAFGHLARAARNLRIMSWAILGYYLIVVTGSYFNGDLAGMVRLPLTREGLLLYGRIGAAIIAYFFGLSVARELYLVTKPQPRAG